MTTTKILLPSSMLNPTRADEHFQWQADKHAEEGMGMPGLVDLSALESGLGKVLRRINEGDQLFYRGWMLTAGEYESLAQTVADHGATLLTSPNQYRTAHYLPGWYMSFAILTPKSIWFPPNTDIADIQEAIPSRWAESLIIKDFVKSRKHEWAEACYVPSVEELPRVLSNFLSLQGEDINGGIVIREFEEFDKNVGEVRAWWVHGELVTITAHPDTPQVFSRPDEDFLGRVGRAVAALRCSFVTTDIVRRVDGQYRVVEVGDGGVSDFPASGDMSSLLRMLSA